MIMIFKIICKLASSPMKQSEVIDSIHYAKRIQTALLPKEKYIEKNLTSKSKK